MATKARRSALTVDQQNHVRAKMLQTASIIAGQLGRYIEDGKIVIAGRDILLTPERLAAYRLILDRTIPTLSATEVTHKSALEGMDQGALVNRLAELVRLRPELGDRLMEALGGRIIECAAQEVPDHKSRNASASSTGDSPPGSRETL